MENTPPTDSAQWQKLPTLSQLTRKHNRRSTLMDSGRANQKWDPLMTPPNTQDVTKMLISPPPEEVLRSAFTRGHHRQGSSSISGGLPSLLASPARPNPITNNASRPASVNSKRKRPGVVTTSIDSSVMDTATNTTATNANVTQGHGETGRQPPEATPNPKPRKQSKRHVRTQSLDSPTRSTFPRLPQDKDMQEMTTPTKSKTSVKARSASPVKAKRVLIQSPHASNPNADFIPPIPVSSASASSAGRYLSVLGSGSGSGRVLSRRSRSATPIPPYEPPKEVFTPPREVTISPPVAPASRSRSRSNAPSEAGVGVEGGRVGVGRVKKELPEIDWTLPMPPPSPGDDPLLLNGRPRRARARSSDSEQQAGEGRSPSPSPTRTGWGVREEEKEEETLQFGGEYIEEMEDLMDVSMDMNMDFPPSTDFSDGDDEGPVIPLFDLGAAVPGAHEGGWSDSDSDSEGKNGLGGRRVGEGAGAGAGEGEYTGRFTMMTVRTKADPPTSATRERMEGWGRPVSPFPGAAFKKRFALPSVGELGGDGGEDEEMGELPVIGDDGDEEEDAESQRDLKVAEEERGEEEDHSLVETARDAVEDHDNDEEEDDDAAEESWRAESADGDYDMSVELRGMEELDHDGASYEQPEPTSFERDDKVVDQGVHLRELHDRGSSAALLDEEEEEETSEHEKSFSFTRELSVEEEEEELEEKQSVDRELSCELRDDDSGGEEQQEEDEGEESEVLRGIGEKAVLDTVRTCESRQARSSSSGRWDKPLRPSDFGQSSPGFARPRSVLQDAGHEAADESVIDVEDASSSGDEGDSLEEGVVTITSNDPLAAARAAAILKLHDYDYLPKIVLKQNRRLSHPTPEDASRNARRKNAVESGISKHPASASPAKKRRRRSTLGGMIGDRVFIPGSPVMTLPELLMHAEEGLEKNNGVAHVTPVKSSSSSVYRDPFKTPGPRSASMPSEAREWTKDDWKQLDACFTDERLDVAEKLGLGSNRIADVDDIRVEDVVERFVEMMGGGRVVEGWGSTWDRDSLLTRTRALQKKQRSGNIAPPTPPGRQSQMSSRLSVVPDFTPITRLRPQHPKLPPPLTDSPFGSLPSKRPKVHGSLLAPRYSHLLEEAIAVSQDVPQPQFEADTSVSSVELEAAGEPVEATDTNHPGQSFDSSVGARQGPSEPAEPSSPGISKRVKGFLFSYLPTLSKSTLPQKSEKPRSSQPGLPLPPPEVLGKTRGPISTPVRPPLPKPIHPKEQVHLQHAPSPKKAALPRPSKPQRLVALHPTPPPAPVMPMPIQRNRRSSGGSVKDLVRSFEDKDSEGMKKPEIKRVRSIGDWKQGYRKEDRPAWKP